MSLLQVIGVSVLSSAVSTVMIMLVAGYIARVFT